MKMSIKESLKKHIIKSYGEDYLRSLEFTMGAEGLFANHPKDTGGMTYAGVARKWNPNWSGWQIIDLALKDYPELENPFTKKPTTLKELNEKLNSNDKLWLAVYDFYYRKYFKKVGADRVYDNLAVILFDISVLQGVKRATKSLQRMLNRNFGASLVVDGMFGTKSMLAVEVAVSIEGRKLVTSELLNEYTDNLVEASKYKNNIIFLNSWMNRVTNLRNYLRII